MQNALQSFLFYVVFSLLLLSFLVFKNAPNKQCQLPEFAGRHMLSLGLLTTAFLVSYSRVYLLYHTCSQVLYVGIAGSIMVITFIAFAQGVLTPLFPSIAAWLISEFFLIQDMNLIPSVL